MNQNIMNKHNYLEEYLKALASTNVLPHCYRDIITEKIFPFYDFGHLIFI